MWVSAGCSNDVLRLRGERFRYLFEGGATIDQGLLDKTDPTYSGYGALRWSPSFSHLPVGGKCLEYLVGYFPHLTTSMTIHML